MSNYFGAERTGLVGATLAVGIALGLAAPGPLSAQQRSQFAPPAMEPDPNLATEDQLAPSQMKQTMPAAVAQPHGAPAKPAPSTLHAQAETPPAPHAAPAHPASASSRVVACSGIFGKDSSHLRLAMTFETKNVTFTDVDANGGSKVQATVLFPKDPKQRLEVWWANPAERSDTYLIVIGGKSMWGAPGGMRLGLNLPQLEKLNHKPFKLKGFDKSGVATVSDWDGGALATLPGGCKSGVSLRADPKAAADAVAAVSADKEYNSSDSAVRALKPTVSEILIGY
ncbi:MAG TPA: hypothetical protein VEK75_09115 [Xanthobacteraceae bacterium]|nr:hypothetical protein [Xanthobacteraceae bacterium]